MDWLEQRSIDYIIAIKMCPTWKLSIRERVRWYEGEAGVQLGEFWYKTEDWPRARRIVVVRQHIKVRPKAVGKLLFPHEEVYCNYRYSAFLTNLKSSAELVWELYRNRGQTVKTGLKNLNMTSELITSACRIFILQRRHYELDIV